MLATILSTANSMVLVVSATIMRNVIKTKAETAEPNKLLLQSRILTFLVGLGGLIIAIALPNIVQLVLNAYYVIGLLFLPFIGGIIWQRATARAADLSIAVGLVATLALLPFFPHQAFLGAVATAIPIFILVSLLTKHSPSEKIQLKEELV